MTDSESDLLFFATVNREIGRDKEAIDFFKSLIQLHPSLDRNKRAHFIATYKPAFDRLRRTVSVPSECLLLYGIEGTTSPLLVGKIEQLLVQTVTELSALCRETLDLIDQVLLPSSDGYQSQVFFHKFRGDLFRYLIQCAAPGEQTTYMESARKAYLRAMEVADNLPPADPVRLGTILNYGVLLHEHTRETALAVETVKAAAEKGREDLAQLSELTRQEAQNVLTQMDYNLVNWEDEEEEVTDIGEEDAPGAK
jgi:14-3-3 protein epsilon